MAYKITVEKCETEIPGGHWIHTPGTIEASTVSESTNALTDSQTWTLEFMP